MDRQNLGLGSSFRDSGSYAGPRGSLSNEAWAAWEKYKILQLSLSENLDRQ